MAACFVLCCSPIVFFYLFFSQNVAGLVTQFPSKQVERQDLLRCHTEEHLKSMEQLKAQFVDDEAADEGDAELSVDRLVFSLASVSLADNPNPPPPGTSLFQTSVLRI